MLNLSENAFLLSHGHTRTYMQKGKMFPGMYFSCFVVPGPGNDCYRENIEYIGCIFMYRGCGTKVWAA